MKVLTILAVSFLLILLRPVSNRGVSFRTSQAHVSNQQLLELQNAPDIGRVGWYLRRAKLTGEKEVILPGITLCGPEMPDLQVALRELNVIVAESIERYIVINDQLGLITWYKFRIIEDLSSERLRECSTCGDADAEQQGIPAQLLPLAPDEIVIHHIGGQLDIDGVNVFQPQTLSVDFSTGLTVDRTMPAKGTESTPYKLVVNRHTFLMFLSIPPGGRRMGLTFGDDGVFSCDPDGELTSFGAAGSIKLHRDENRMHSLTTLREFRNRLRDRL